MQAKNKKNVSALEQTAKKRHIVQGWRKSRNRRKRDGGVPASAGSRVDSAPLNNNIAAYDRWGGGRQKIPVVAVYPDGRIVWFESQTDAAAETGCHRGNINAALRARGGRRTAGGARWTYAPAKGSVKNASEK